MDSNHRKLTNPTNWELRMAMEDEILHNQSPTDSSLWPNYLLQTHKISCSSSTQIPPSAHCFDDHQQVAENHNLQDHQMEEEEYDQEAEEELGPMKEMMYKIAAMQPVDIDPATIRKPRRRNVRISDDPQSVAARHRRERISEKIRILQRLVPGGTKLDTASMLDEAVRYVKFLKRQIRQLQLNHNPSFPVLHNIPPPEWSFVPSKSLGSGTEPPGASDIPSELPDQAAILHALGRR